MSKFSEWVVRIAVTAVLFSVLYVAIFAPALRIGWLILTGQRITN